MEKVTFKSDNVQYHWATPILQCKLKKHSSLNKQLTKIITTKLKESTKITSNIGTWRSEDNLLRYEFPEIKTLQEIISNAVYKILDYFVTQDTFTGDILIEAWANVYSSGDYQTPHIHHDSNWSGVYFVSIDQNINPGNGALILIDPRINVKNLKEYTIKPEAGLIVVFPSWLKHWVAPYYGNKKRISIAFNAKHI